MQICTIRTPFRYTLYISIFMCVSMYKHIYPMCMCANFHITYINMCMCVYISIYLCVCIYTHTYIQYVYAQTCTIRTPIMRT